MAELDLATVDREVLAFWAEHGIFARTIEKTAGQPRWTFYEGPPTANGMPGTHHVEARVFKDVFPRFQTMCGKYVERKAGWDCHGLPVEVAVEKELGISGKRDIEKYGVAAFNAKCRESVERHVDAFAELTERMGYWVDLSQAYRTMDSSYVESVWWSLKQVHDAGRLVRDYRVSPYCPRCGTPLSDHELGQPDVYQTVDDPSIYVRFPITTGPLAGTTDLLIWTTTPWTLIADTMVAVHPELTYAVVRRAGEERALVVAEPLVEAALGEGWTVEQTVEGRALEGTGYQRPYDSVEIEGAHTVVLSDVVTVEDGTGLVHMDPAYGIDDFAIGRAYGFPVVNPIGGDGRFDAGLPLVGGLFFKDADQPIIDDLRERGLLFRAESYEHNYPHCWRCGTPLLYYALPSWFITTTAIQDELLEQNELTNWFPSTIKHGRYGEWLRNNVDWALSRSRYWGTPLPIWHCANDHLTSVGSLAELGKLAGADLSELDPHRPYVDAITFDCPACGETAQRVPEVIDAWYDSGSMPFAQWGYPWVEGSAERFERAYPAQFISEAIDQTRGWFYSLMAVGTLTFGRSSYENVVCLGLILAEDGRKMSKHLGNVLQPLPLLERHGADAVRWFMACSGSPWASRRVGDATIQDVVRKVILTYWNTVAFFDLYAVLSGWTPASSAPAPGERPVLDRWLLSEAHRLVGEAEAAYEGFDTARLGQLFGRFVDDLSNWYVRRSRRRFWAGDPAALATLHEALRLLTMVMAPLVPFITEKAWQTVVRPGSSAEPESVHLADWPAAVSDLVDDSLAASVGLARRVVELGRAARAEAKVRTRQPLRRAVVGSRGWTSLSPELRREVADELNVLEVEGLTEAGEALVSYVVKPNFRTLGKRFGKDTPRVAAAVTAADPTVLAASLSDSGSATVVVDGAEVVLSVDELLVSERPQEGWAVANAHGETVALDLAVDAELRRAGLAREAVRAVQEARKAAGLDVSDRIHLWWTATDDETAAAIREHQSTLADEVLATVVSEGPPDTGTPYTETVEALGATIWLSKAV
ncbi:isoleucine--tRNA ligase [Flindersiella endophytica]